MWALRRRRGGGFSAPPSKEPPLSVVGLRRTPLPHPLIHHGGRRLCVRVGPPRRARLGSATFPLLREHPPPLCTFPPSSSGSTPTSPDPPFILLKTPFIKFPKPPFRLFVHREGVLGVVEGKKKKKP